MAAAVTAIRRAGEADFDALTDVWERAAASTHSFMDAGDLADMRPYVRDLLLPSMDVWAVDAGGGSGPRAEDGSQPVGFIGARGDHVELLYVDPAHHGIGIGTALLAHVTARTVEVYAGNEAGLGFYTAHGFAETRRDPIDVAGRPFPVIHLAR